jgi:hypothetical protein
VDSGIGIPADKLTQILEAFCQVAEPNCFARGVAIFRMIENRPDIFSGFGGLGGLFHRNRF